MAAFQFRMGLFQRAEAACVAKNTTFIAEASLGNIRRFFVAFRITLLSDSIALVV
jgi:hypothetical protein